LYRRGDPCGRPKKRKIKQTSGRPQGSPLQSGTKVLIEGVDKVHFFPFLGLQYCKNIVK